MRWEPYGPHLIWETGNFGERLAQGHITNKCAEFWLKPKSLTLKFHRYVSC